MTVPPRSTGAGAMVVEDELSRLTRGLLDDPFRVLGGRPGRSKADAGDFLWRALLPHAAAAWLHTRHGWRPMAGRGGGVFEWHGGRGEVPAHPLIRWTDSAGDTCQRVDPYSFRPKLPGRKLRRFSAGTAFDGYRLLGAHPRRRAGHAGVRFAVWAPGARRVSVVGDFNRWHGHAHPLAKLPGTGVWTLFVPGLAAGERYGFELADGCSVWRKADPYAFRAGPGPGAVSLVTAPGAYRWQDAEWLRQRACIDGRRRPLSVYHVHVPSWGAPGSRPDYRSLAIHLVNYVKARGFTHIGLMPINEHPAEDSWGYDASAYFAPAGRYGSPDDLRHFVDRAHRHGIGVILDWPAGHFPRDPRCLVRFDGTRLYEHTDPSRPGEPDWRNLVFDFARHEVRSFLFSNAAYWLEEFHFDGLRVDRVAAMLHLDHGRADGEWTPNEFGGNENLAALSFLRELNSKLAAAFPGVLTIAGDTGGWPMVTRPARIGGLGFSLTWNLGWTRNTLAYLRTDPGQRSRNRETLAAGIRQAFRERFLLPLPEDEVVHGKGSLLASMPGDRWQRFANLRLLYSSQFCLPGRKLLFMGNEIAAEQEWRFRATLDWGLLDDPAHLGMLRLVQDLNALLHAIPALHELDFDPRGFAWLRGCSRTDPVIAFMRKAADGGHAICLFNPDPVPRSGFRLGVPDGGDYHERLNSDSVHYGGSNAGNGGKVSAEPMPGLGQPFSLSLTVPPLGALILTPAAAAPHPEPDR